MADLFKEVVPSILTKGDYALLTEEDVKEYVPFVVNRAIASYPDCCLLVNELNLHPNLDKKLQYDFLFHAVYKRKRPFQKWMKKSEVENLKCVMEYFNYSELKAKEALRVLTENDLKKIKETIHRGGC